MTQQERIMVGEKWLAIAQMFSKELNQVALKMMLDSVNDLDAEKTCLALEKWVSTTKLGRHPFPSELRDMVNPILDPEAKGKLAASRVIEAVSKFGYTHPEAAKEFIGDLGWQAVKRFGGWQYICENLGVTLQQLTFQAQVRDICISTEKASVLGMQDQPIQIGHTENNSRLESTNTLEKTNFTKLLNVIKPSGGHNET